MGHIVWDNLNIHYDGKSERWTKFNAAHGGKFAFHHTPIHASCVIRSMSAGRFGPCRPPISVDAGRVFRSHAGRFWSHSEMGGRDAEMWLILSSLDR